jgi:hypothetical protein
MADAADPKLREHFANYDAATGRTRLSTRTSSVSAGEGPSRLNDQ